MAIPEVLQSREYDKFREGKSGKTVVAVTYDSDAVVPTESVVQNPVNYFDETLTDAGNDVDVLDLVATSETNVLRVGLSCFIEGKMTISVDSNKIMTARTSPGKPNILLPFNVTLSAGQNINIKFKARDNSPQAEVEAYINASLV